MATAAVDDKDKSDKDLDDFITTGRSGRRNAIVDGSEACNVQLVSTDSVAEGLESMKLDCATNDATGAQGKETEVK